MAEENRVTLHGFWASPYSKRVELALKLKGIPYEYVEEDLRNKSQLLLKYNPVHKKVLVLVHNGKPIAESLVVLEYIDETWKNAPKLLPEDPHTRSQVRFWASFLQQQLFESVLKVLKTEGETQEKALKQVSEKLNLLEEGLKSFYSDGNPCIDVEHVGLHDLVLVSFFGGYKVYEELLGIKLLDPEKNPLIYSRLTVLKVKPTTAAKYLPYLLHQQSLLPAASSITKVYSQLPVFDPPNVPRLSTYCSSFPFTWPASYDYVIYILYIYVLHM